MDRSSLIESIITRMGEVWGDDGFTGGPEQYAWLLEHFEISEEEDVQWQLVLDYDADSLSRDDQNDPDVMQFVEDDDKVVPFLKSLLHRYQSKQMRYIP